MEEVKSYLQKYKALRKCDSTRLETSLSSGTNLHEDKQAAARIRALGDLPKK